MQKSCLRLAATATLLTTAIAGETAAKKVVEVEEKSWCESLWEYPVLYKNKDSNFLNEFRLVGRFQVDQYMIDSDLGHDQDWTIRRFRLGAKAVLFKKLTAHAEVDLDLQNDNPAYRRLTDAYLAWEFSDAATIKVGKQGMPFTLDGATSSTRLITIDRNNLSNNLWFPTEYLPGVSLSGKLGQWVYHTGVYSGGSESPEFGNFDAGWCFLASVGYDFGKQFGVKQALLRADYVYNQRDPDSQFTRSLENVGALVFILDTGRWGLGADVAGGSGYGRQGDVFGFNVMPWYNITDNLQVVARYTYLNSDDANAIRFSRYENAVTSGRGDEYNEIYGGLNYYICGHKLKLQTGVAYTTMKDQAADGGSYAGWSWTTGLRISW
jgi:phosphate-selective porin OprO and OprP